MLCKYLKLPHYNNLGSLRKILEPLRKFKLIQANKMLYKNKPITSQNNRIQNRWKQIYSKSKIDRSKQTPKTKSQKYLTSHKNTNKSNKNIKNWKIIPLHKMMSWNKNHKNYRNLNLNFKNWKVKGTKSKKGFEVSHMPKCKHWAVSLNKGRKSYKDYSRKINNVVYTWTNTKGKQVIPKSKKIKKFKQAKGISTNFNKN